MQVIEHIAYDLIIDTVPVGAKVLDLGCGNGDLLERLMLLKAAHTYGVEISSEGVSRCVERGLYCYQGDIDEGLADYRDNSFDVVILNQTLQIVKRPAYVLCEMMRISRIAVVSFPNFGYLKTRLQLLIRGTMPKNDLLPYEWYETPNIHLLTIRDFRNFCDANRFPVKSEKHFCIGNGASSKPVRYLPNLLAQYGFFILDGETYTKSMKKK